MIDSFVHDTLDDKFGAFSQDEDVEIMLDKGASSRSLMEELQACQKVYFFNILL